MSAPALPPGLLPPPPLPDPQTSIAITWITIGIAHGLVALLYLAFCLSVPVRREVCYRERLHAWLVVSRSGTALTALHAISSLASCVLFICEGYLVPLAVLSQKNYRAELPVPYLLAEQVLQPIFLYHYMLLFYVAGSQRCSYVISLMSIIDLVTVIPVYIDLFEMLVRSPLSRADARARRRPRTPTPRTGRLVRRARRRDGAG